MPENYESIHVQGDYWLMRRYASWYPMRRTPQGTLAFLNGPSDNHDGSRESAERIIAQQKMPTTLPHSEPAWFNQYGHFLGELSAECVADCSHSGECYQDVKYWRERLDFTVPRNLAIRYLRGTGEWSADELAELSDVELAYKVLWLACCDIKESGEWFGLCE